MKLFAVIMLLVRITRRISATALALAGAVLFVSSSSPALTQTPQAGSQPQTPQTGSQPQTPQTGSQPQEPEAGIEDNPTRAVFFSVREEYRNLIDGAWNNRIVLRRDAVALKGKFGGGRTGYLLRTDVPITTTHLGSETHTGLGDIYIQALYIPYLSRKFAFVTGTGFVLPTATEKTLGQGKWQVAPLAVPVWFLPRKKGYVQVKFQDFISVAGVGDRPDVHMLLITSALNYVPAGRWLVNTDFESRTNWRNGNRTDFRVGFGAGRVITRRFFIGVKCEVPVGATRPGDWTLKLTNIFFR